MSPMETLASIHPIEPNGSQRYCVSFDASKDSVYLLPADEQERERSVYLLPLLLSRKIDQSNHTRLNIQGGTLNTVFGNKLIWAPLTLKHGDTVLDSGTGSGTLLGGISQRPPFTQ